MWVNVEHAASGPGGLLARVIAGSPPVILFGALELVADQFLRSARHDHRGRSGQVDQTVDGEVTPVVVADQPVPVAHVAAGATAVATHLDGGDEPATSPVGARQVTPGDLIGTPAELGATARARRPTTYRRWLLLSEQDVRGGCGAEVMQGWVWEGRNR